MRELLAPGPEERYVNVLCPHDVGPVKRTLHTLMIEMLNFLTENEVLGEQGPRGPAFGKLV